MVQRRLNPWHHARGRHQYACMALVQVVGFDLETSRKFIFAEPFGEAALAKYASGIVDGRIKPHFKSEEPPAEPYEDNVRVVVGKNFDEVRCHRAVEPAGGVASWKDVLCSSCTS